MIFAERKKESGFEYDVEDVFGTIHIDSSTKLDPSTLDEMVLLLLRQNLNAGEIRGEVKHAKGTVSYVFKPRTQWEDDDEKKPCEDTPTSTPAPESASTPTSHFVIDAFNWCKKFAEAFRVAWRKARE